MKNKEKLKRNLPVEAIVLLAVPLGVIGWWCISGELHKRGVIHAPEYAFSVQELEATVGFFDIGADYERKAHAERGFEFVTNVVDSTIRSDVVRFDSDGGIVRNVERIDSYKKIGRKYLEDGYIIEVSSRAYDKQGERIPYGLSIWRKKE